MDSYEHATDLGLKRISEYSTIRNPANRVLEAIIMSSSNRKYVGSEFCNWGESERAPVL